MCVCGYVFVFRFDRVAMAYEAPEDVEGLTRPGDLGT